MGKVEQRLSERHYTEVKGEVTAEGEALHKG